MNSNSPDANRRAGLLLIGHGTRDETGQREFSALGEQVRERLAGVPCEAASLEFAEPNINEGVSRLAAEGVNHVVAVPALLFAAGHVKRDIPEALEAAAAKHPGLTARITDYLGCHPPVIALSILRFSQAIHRAQAMGWPSDLSQTLLLMVGRGSHDPTATAEMLRFAQLRAERAPLGGVEVCFTAMAEPTLEQGLQRAAEGRWRRVVVQPHLLFRGELLNRVRLAVEDRQQSGNKQWLLTEHLGVHELTVEAVLNLAGH